MLVCLPFIWVKAFPELVQLWLPWFQSLVMMVQDQLYPWRLSIISSLLLQPQPVQVSHFILLPQTQEILLLLALPWPLLFYPQFFILFEACPPSQQFLMLRLAFQEQPVQSKLPSSFRQLQLPIQQVWVKACFLWQLAWLLLWQICSPLKPASATLARIQPLKLL